jgi:hypothetical protein
MDAVGPSDLTDDEAAAIIAAVTPAWERKYRRFSADIVDLDLVRNHPTRNRT